MDNNNRKIVLLKGDSNKCYEQAIFILRPQAVGMAAAEIDFVKEAERIIGGETLQRQLAEKYEQNAQKPPKNKKDGKEKPPKSSFDKKLNIALLITGLVMVASLVYNML